MKNILNNWSFIRILRMGIGFAIIMQAIYAKDMFLGIAGALFSVMALLNIGNCGAQGCSTHIQKPNTHSEEITYEEVR